MDPTIARFISADPHIQSSYDTQSYNRYTYVKNNPLKYTDPSGYFFKKLFKKIKKWIKPILQIAVTIVVGIATAGAGFSILAAGFAGGFTGTLLNGGSLGDAFKAGLKGGFWGAVSAGVAFGVAEGIGIVSGLGSNTGHSLSFFSAKAGQHGWAAMKAVVHGLTRAVITKAQGGRWSSGFWSGFASSGFAAPNSWGVGKGTMFTAVMSGTVSEISGGKFANGAVTGAFVHLFNHGMKDAYMKKALRGDETKTIENARRAAKAADEYSKYAGYIATAANRLPIFGTAVSGIFFGVSSVLSGLKHVHLFFIGEGSIPELLHDSMTLTVPNQTASFLSGEALEKVRDSAKE